MSARSRNPLTDLGSLAVALLLTVAIVWGLAWAVVQ